jgi:hypothetical protein
MKDLIFITAYCPDEKRENILRDLASSLQKFKDDFDIMVVSHTAIPLDIQKKVNFCFYDSKNEILTDWDLLNQPWFSPNNDRRIQSSFLSRKNTHLAIWRMFVLGFSLAKNMGYNKVHHIEYDCYIVDDSEFKENSDLLNEYDSVIYINKQENIDDILFGSVQSYLVSKLDDILINLDEEAIKNLIRSSESKSPELMLQTILESNNKKVFKKDRKKLEEKGNRFGIVDGQMENRFNPWGVPYYDRLTNNVGFVVWNTTHEEGVEYKVIVNDTKIMNVSKTMMNYWSLMDLGKMDEIDSILVIENNKIRDIFNLTTPEEIEVFKNSSFRHK